MIEPVDHDKIISLRVKGLSEREICKKLHCEISDVHAAIDGLARSMLNDSTRYRQLAIELCRTEALVKTFISPALAGDAQSAMVLAKLGESTRIMLGLRAPRDGHPVLEQIAEPERQTGIDRISAVIERLCATPATDPERQLTVSKLMADPFLAEVRRMYAMRAKLRATLRVMHPDARLKLLAELGDDAADSWVFGARDEQLPPEDLDWCFLFLGGRGCGKTRRWAALSTPRCALG